MGGRTRVDGACRLMNEWLCTLSPEPGEKRKADPSGRPKEGQAEGQAAGPGRGAGDPLTSSSCAALGRVSGFLSRAVFRKSRNSADLGAQVAQ